MQVVGVQLDIAWEDKQANFASVERLLAGAQIAPGALVVLPELFATGFTFKTANLAEPDAGETRDFLARLAARYECTVLGGVATRDAEGRVFNQALAVDHAGRELARYSKQQPFNLGGEGRCYAAGSKCVAFDWGEFRVAPFVCYDLRFPETIRPALGLGANVIAIIASWPELRDPHWLALLVARAIENQCYVIGVNRAGRDPLLAYRGHSLIVGPDGVVLAAAGEQEEVLTATFDFAKLEAYRRQYPFLADIRPGVLG